MVIIYRDAGKGWEPITYMVRLAAELFDAQLITIDMPRDRPSPFTKLKMSAPRVKRRTSGDSLLVVCPQPTDLDTIFYIGDWKRQFRCVAAWVIDSFWVDRISTLDSWLRPFDQLFVTGLDDVSDWVLRTRTPTAWLPWGSDVLRLGGFADERDLDLTRIGRQPPEWDDDRVTAKDCDARGIAFQGRPPMKPDPVNNQEMLMSMYRRTKFLVAFSNTASPANYTHPCREYLTARWTDALAAGATVAGIAPKEAGTDWLLWPDATLDFGSIERAHGLHVVSGALQAWTPAQARHNYWRALERLDWRWRFRVLAEFFDESPEPLKTELTELKCLLEGRERGRDGWE